MLVITVCRLSATYRVFIDKTFFKVLQFCFDRPFKVASELLKRILGNPFYRIF